MKVNKQFAPITITIDYQEELEFLFAILQDAERNYMANGPRFFSPRKYTDSYMQKINYFREQLK